MSNPKSRKKALILLWVFFGLSLALVFELGLLLYMLGEPQSIEIHGSELEFLTNLAEQVRLGHIVEVAKGGEITVFYGGQLHQFSSVPVGTRLGAALFDALKGNYGPMVSMNASVQDYLWPAFGRTMLAGLAMFGSGALSYFACLVKKPTRTLGLVGLSLGLLSFVAGMILFFLNFVPSWTFVLCFAIANGSIGFTLGLGKPMKDMIAYPFLATALGDFLLFLQGTIKPSYEGNIEQLFFQGLYQADNHLYSVALVFALVPITVFLFAGLILHVYFPGLWGKGANAFRKPLWIKR